MKEKRNSIWRWNGSGAPRPTIRRILPYGIYWKMKWKGSTIIYGQNKPFSESTIPRSTNVSTRCHSICTELLRLLQACSSTFHSSHFFFWRDFTVHTLLYLWIWFYFQYMQRKILLRVFFLEGRSLRSHAVF